MRSTCTGADELENGVVWKGRDGNPALQYVIQTKISLCALCGKLLLAIQLHNHGTASGTNDALAYHTLVVLVVSCTVCSALRVVSRLH